MMFNKILPTGNKTIIVKIVKRICILILGLLRVN